MTDAVEKWRKRKLPPLRKGGKIEWKRREVPPPPNIKPYPQKSSKLPLGHSYGDINRSEKYDCRFHGKKFVWKERCWKCYYFLRLL